MMTTENMILMNDDAFVYTEQEIVKLKGEALAAL